MNCKAEPYNPIYKNTLAGIYNDFKAAAAKDYKFELEPLSYEKFIESIEKGLIRCIVLIEDEVPAGFLVYTTLISEAVELNIIHCTGGDINEKRKLLLEKFMLMNKELIKEKIVIYPLLGVQASFSEDIKNFGFKTVNMQVMSFNPADASQIQKLKEMQVNQLNKDYLITNWKYIYKRHAAEIIHDAFYNSEDALFDSRFKSYKGCIDIISKITDNIYGDFLPDITKVLLYKNRPAGVIFMNMTSSDIANIPIAAVMKKHKGKGLSKIMMKQAVLDFLNYILIEGRTVKELNAGCCTYNEAAAKMYSAAGFVKDYSYFTAYHPA